MPIVRDSAVIDSPWSTAGPVPESALRWFSLAEWRQAQTAPGQNNPDQNDPDQNDPGQNAVPALRLASDDPADSIGADVHRFRVIALDFPTFRDGRSYSNARLLREQYGFKGELRAVGDVGRDQFLFMHRCGINAFEVATAAEAAALHTALAEIGVWYQRTADGRTTTTDHRHAG